MTNGGGANPRYANGARRRGLRERVRAIGAPCHICGLPIDYSLPATHPCSFEVDEIVPVSKGGSPTDFGNTAAAHRVCNQWRSNRSMSAVAQTRDTVRERYGGWRTPEEFCSLAKASRASGKKGTPIKRPTKRSNVL